MQSFYLSLDCATVFVAKHFIQSISLKIKSKERRGVEKCCKMNIEVITNGKGHLDRRPGKI